MFKIEVMSAYSGPKRDFFLRFAEKFYSSILQTNFFPKTSLKRDTNNIFDNFLGITSDP